MPRRSRIRKVLFWGVVLLIAATAGVLGFAYSYVTDGATLATAIRREAPRFLPGSTLGMGRVQWWPLRGRITLNQVRLTQMLDDQPFATSQIAWLDVRCDLRALIHGKFIPTEVSVVEPLLRLRKRRDGTWNLQGLLADPWPAPPLETEPVLLIKRGTLELSDETGQTPVMVLRDVDVHATPTPGGGPVRFEATARGGPFDLLRLEGTLDRHTGRIELTKGDLSRLELTDTFCRCLPDLARERFAALGLSGGEADVILKSLVFDPRAPEAKRVRCDTSVQVRSATLKRPHEMPFPLTGVSMLATYTNGTLVIEHAEGRDGKTLMKLRGTVSADDPANGPLNLHVEVTDLELDSRLYDKTPPEFRKLWEEYRPEGWVSVGMNVSRTRVGAPVGFGVTVGLQDVSMTYHLFPYPVQHGQGTLKWQGDRLDIDARTLIGGEWATCKGTVENPGPNALVKLNFASKSVPVDEMLLKAMPPDIRSVVNEFHPTGSARGTVHLTRQPPTAEDPKGPIEIHAEVDLNENCSVKWDGLPYSVQDLTGHLDLKNDMWTFTNMKARNGPATISADGKVRKIGPGARDIALELTLHAEHMPFDEQLRHALPAHWQATWSTLNPYGFSRVDARITAQTGGEPHYHLTIVPERDQTQVQLILTPPADAPPPRQVTKLPRMENVTGTFRYDDGNVIMTDVSFVFREAPVKFKRGEVVLKDNGSFRMAVQELQVTKLRLDAELRRIMPPVMAQFAQRLDDGKSFRIIGDLGIGWSGQNGVPARCEWKNTTVIFLGNTIQSGVPLEQLQGQIDHVWGWSDGHAIETSGLVNLASMHLLGQQITELSTPIAIKGGQATLENIHAKLLGGDVYGAVAVSLDASPHYRADLQLIGADLTRYAMTLPGKQNLRGVATGRLTIQGDGSDLRTCVGEGQATITRGDLGQLPQPWVWVKVANFKPPTKTAFDTVDLHATIADGRATFDRISLTGDAFSFTGEGTLQLQGEREIDMRLKPHYGRDERRLPLFGDAVREASTRVFEIHVTGPVSAPTIRPVPLPDVIVRASGAMRKLNDRRQERPTTNERP